MAEAVETEIKLAASRGMLERLRHSPILASTDNTSTLVTTYFDTVGGRLRIGGAALRIRDTGEGQEQTLKLAQGGIASVRRGEWTAPIKGNDPDPSHFPEQAQDTIARLLDGAPVHPVALSRIERTTRQLQANHSTVEIAFDVGAIIAGTRQEPVCELELELIDGQLIDLLHLAQSLPLGPELNWSVRSKAERCNALAFDLPQEAVQATHVALTPDIDVASAFQAIAWNCLDHLLANYPVVIETGNHEAIHQCRVAIRRLRAAFNLFRDIVDDSERRILNAAFKAAAATLGTARDAYLLREQVTRAAEAHREDARELLLHLEAREIEAIQSVQTMLAEEPFQRLLFQYAAWIEGGEWLTQTGETDGDRPLGPYAAHLLHRRQRRLQRKSKAVSAMSDTARHRLRIFVKKLRYATGFFGALYRDKPVRKSVKRDFRRFTKALAQLQDSLGVLNDMAVANIGREALFSDLDPITAARLETQMNELLAPQKKAEGKLLQSAEQALSHLRNLHMKMPGR